MKSGPAENPTGGDIRDEGILYDLQSEIDKISSARKGESPDWKKVLDLSTEILRDYSRDVLAASENETNPKKASFTKNC